MNLRTVNLMLADGTIGRGEVAYPSRPPWNLQLSSDDLGSIVVQGDDLFECLRELRRVLEPLGYKILCAGSRRDTWASTISRRWDGGASLHVLVPGYQASDDNMVEIFDPASADQIGTVQEQAEYYRKCLQSFERLDIAPPQKAVDEARLCPGGRIYQIEGKFPDNVDIPAEAIMGAWNVDMSGRIKGGFIPNPNYRPRNEGHHEAIPRFIRGSTKT